MNDRSPSTAKQTTHAEIGSGQSVGSIRDHHMLSCPFRSEVERRQTRCLALIRQRRYLRATQAAKKCYELSADKRSLRLLATCYLLQGDFASALATLAKAGDRKREP